MDLIAESSSRGVDLVSKLCHDVDLVVKWICRGLDHVGLRWHGGSDRSLRKVDLGAKWICRGLGDVDLRGKVDLIAAWGRWI